MSAADLLLVGKGLEECTAIYIKVTDLMTWSECVEAPGMVSTESEGEPNTRRVVLRSTLDDCLIENSIISAGIIGVSPSASSVRRFAVINTSQCISS